LHVAEREERLPAYNRFSSLFGGELACFENSESFGREYGKLKEVGVGKIEF